MGSTLIFPYAIFLLSVICVCTIDLFLAHSDVCWRNIATHLVPPRSAVLKFSTEADSQIKLRDAPIQI